MNKEKNYKENPSAKKLFWHVEVYAVSKIKIVNSVQR
jgi:hypothetical protein